MLTKDSKIVLVGKNNCKYKLIVRLSQVSIIGFLPASGRFYTCFRRVLKKILDLMRMAE